MRLLGVELYFEDLERARPFYIEVLGLKLMDEARGHYARFDGEDRFVCAECKGSENYPSQDKAVIFFEVPDLAAAVARVGPERIVKSEPAGEGRRQAWAVLHDPEGHNVLLLEARAPAALK